MAARRAGANVIRGPGRLLLQRGPLAIQSKGATQTAETAIVSHRNPALELRPPRSAGRLVRPGDFTLLTEAEVQRSFRNLFKSKDVPHETFDKAENLLDELRPESPLRHRLSIELEELRKMHTAKA